MRVSAGLFAIVLWAIAAFILIVEVARILTFSNANGWLLVGTIAINLLYVGAIAGLGAIVALLGEIRDQQARR